MCSECNAEKHRNRKTKENKNLQLKSTLVYGSETWRMKEQFKII